LTLSNNSILKVSNIIAACPAPALAPLLPPVSHILSSIESVDVVVVNLAYPESSRLSINGFGFLVPDGSDTDILGIVLDSCAVAGQSTDGLVRVSVMIGGHMFPRVFGEGTESALGIAVNACEEYLGLDGVLHSEVNLQRNAIPQYFVGHDEKMKELHEWGRDNRIGFVGAWYAGVSVNDCVFNGIGVARGVLEGRKVSGLERCL
jgi:oxygen-dependent protoporphyrinogen oxidase